MDRNVAAEQLDPVSQGIYGNYNNILEPFFGPEKSPAVTNPHELRNRNAWTLADAKAGTADYLGTTATDLLLTANQTWMTSIILPYEMTDNINFTWMKFEYNAHILHPTAAFGASRLMKQRKFSRSESLRRVGLAFQIEHDFARTPEGRVSFIASLAQLTRASQEYANAEGVKALLFGHANANYFINTETTVSDRTIREYFERDRERFAMVQKDDHALEKASVDIAAELEKHNGGYADTWIVSSKMSDYGEFRPERTEYWRAGERGPARIDAPHPLDNPVPTRFVKEDPMYQVRSRYIEGVGEADPLGRLRQTGSYNTMREECGDFDHYESSSRNRQIYDEDKDRWATITLLDAIKYCGLFNKKGELEKPKPHRMLNPAKNGGMEHDFLMFKNPNKEGIRQAQYFGDIDRDFLPIGTVMNCARTLRGAIKNRMGAQSFENLVSGLGSLAPNEAELYPAYTKLGDVQTLLDTFANILSTLIGSNPLYGKLTGEAVYQIMVLKNVAPVQARISGQAQGEVDKIGSDFLNNLLVPAPSTKMDELQKLVQEADMTNVYETADKIQAKYEEYAQEKVKGKKFNQLLKAPGIAQFVQTRKDHYAKMVEEIRTKGEVKSDEIVGYMKTGQDLSNTDYKYVNPASARNIANPLASIPFFRAILDQKAMQQEAAEQRRGGPPGPVRRGDGTFAGIGRVIRDGGEARRRKKRPADDPLIGGLDTDQIGFSWHVDAIAKSGASLMDRVLALAFLGIRITQQNLENMAHNNICIPIDFILARPHQQRHTQSIIKCARGGVTGKTFFTMPGIEIAHEANTKYSEVHYTMWIRSIVLNPEYNWVQHDAYADDYLGGNGVEFYTPESYPHINWDDIRQSIICIAIPVTERDIGDKNGTLDLTGAYSTDYVETLGQKIEDINQGKIHYSTYWRYNTMYNFNNQLRRGTARPHTSMTARHLNRVCEPAAQKRYLPKTGEWSERTVNRDHFGPDLVGPGTADIRRGKKRYINALRVIPQQ